MNPSTPPTAPSPAPPEGLAARLGPAGVLGVLWAFFPAVCGSFLLVYADKVGLWLRGHEANGPYIYTAGFILLSGLGLLPTYAVAILGGWAFGLAVGLPAALAGFFGGSLIGYGISRFASGDRVEKIIAEKPAWRAIRDALIGGSFLKTLAIVTLVRLPPNSPFALTNLVLASVRVPLLIYSLGTLLGMAPRTAVVLYIATLVRDMTAKDAAKQTPWWYYVIMAAASLLVLVVIGAIAKSALRRVTGGQHAGEADVGEA